MVLIIVFIVLIIMVMNIYFCGVEVRLVLYWVRVVILKYMFRILFVYDVGESCFSFYYNREERDRFTKVYGKFLEFNLKIVRNKNFFRKKEMSKFLKYDLGCEGENL